MALHLSDIVEEARLSARALKDYGEHFFNPTIRLGVTGLSRAGKTVFITALIHGLTRGGRFPIFEPLATGRIARARLAPQPDDDVPRFDYENHVRTLIEERRWPNSTVDISELRLVIDYQRQNGADHPAVFRAAGCERELKALAAYRRFVSVKDPAAAFQGRVGVGLDLLDVF